MIPFGRSCCVLSVALVAASAVLLDCASVHAEELISTYTWTKPQLCRKTKRVIIDGDEYASTRVCPGKAGYAVIVDDDDLRTTVTIGKKGKANAVIAGGSEGRFSSVHDTVEWRSGFPFSVYNDQQQLVEPPYDRQRWFRVRTAFDGAEMTVEHAPEHDSVYYAYFEPYSWERHLDLLGRADSSSPEVPALQVRACRG